MITKETFDFIVRSIQTTSGMEGLIRLISMDLGSFIKWYKLDYSYCDEEGVALGDKVVETLTQNSNYAF